VATGGDVPMNIIDVDKIVEMIKGDIGKPMALGVWEFRAFGKSLGVGFYFKSAYEIVKVIRENQRVKVHIDIQLFDSWEMFQQAAQRIFINVVKGQLLDQMPEIEGILDIVIMETEEVMH
jgi:hypothetical protein